VFLAAAWFGLALESFAQGQRVVVLQMGFRSVDQDAELGLRIKSATPRWIDFCVATKSETPII
jgi:hypothetical protein